MALLTEVRLFTPYQPRLAEPLLPSSESLDQHALISITLYVRTGTAQGLDMLL
jgi:hypothetical protein